MSDQLKVPGPAREELRARGLVQVAFVYDTALDALEEWLDCRGLTLFPIPTDDPDSTPTYGITTKGP